MLYLALYIRFASPAATNGEVGGTPAGGIVGVVFIYLYAFGWSFGHSVACYVVAAEIFPTRIVSNLPGLLASEYELTASFSARSVCPSAFSSTGLSTTGSQERLPT